MYTQKLTASFAVLLLITTLCIFACKSDDDSCTVTTWYEDADQDGLGNPDVSQEACEQPSGYVSDNTDPDDAVNSNTLHAAFGDFDTDNYNIYLDGSEVVIETNGLPLQATASLDP